MYENFLFVLIYGLFVCMYVCTCARKVGISFFGGVLPSAAMYRYNYMFLLIYVW